MRRNKQKHTQTPPPPPLPVGLLLTLEESMLEYVLAQFKILPHLLLFFLTQNLWTSSQSFPCSYHNIHKCLTGFPVCIFAKSDWLKWLLLYLQLNVSIFLNTVCNLKVVLQSMTVSLILNFLCYHTYAFDELFHSHRFLNPFKIKLTFKTKIKLKIKMGSFLPDTVTMNSGKQADSNITIRWTSLRR